MKGLKLFALDEDDLTILSAHCQDSSATADEMKYDRSGKRFFVPLNRFVWESIRAEDGAKGEAEPKAKSAQEPKPLAAEASAGAQAESAAESHEDEGFKRCLSVLHFERVESVSHRRVERGTKQILNLLAIAFRPSESPAGEVELIFAGDVSILLRVECLEAQLTDLPEAWETQSRPDHDGAKSESGER